MLDATTGVCWRDLFDTADRMWLSFVAHTCTATTIATKIEYSSNCCASDDVTDYQNWLDVSETVYLNTSATCVGMMRAGGFRWQPLACGTVLPFVCRFGNRRNNNNYCCLCTGAS